MSNTKKVTDLSQLNFESAYQQLESIVEKMELGEQDLEQSLTDFEQGVSLMKHCHKLLKDAEQKIDILVKDSDGVLSTEPFDTQD